VRQEALGQHEGDETERHVDANSTGHDQIDSSAAPSEGRRERGGDHRVFMPSRAQHVARMIERTSAG